MFIEVGIITKPHGLKGEVKILPFHYTYDEFMEYFTHFYLNNPPYTPEPAKILHARKQNQLIIAQIDCIPDRTKAEQMQNTLILVKREHLPTPEENEYYYIDLIGSLCYFQGELLGELVNMQNYGTCDIFEIKLEHQQSKKGKPKHIMIPFYNNLIEEINQENKAIHFKDIEDYLE